MADNKKFAGVDGNYTYASDEIAGVDHPYSKLEYGPADTATVVRRADSATEGPLPVNAYLATDFILAAGLALTPKYAVINLTATGTLVAAVASKKIRVLALAMTLDVLTGDETYTFKSGAAGTVLTGAIGDSSISAGVAGTPPFAFVLPFNPLGWFETTSGVLLELALAGTTPIAAGSLVYVEVA